MGALAAQESGNPNAVNEHSGAHGAWQVMPSNWPKWSAQAGIPNAPKTMENQRRVVAHKLTEYYNGTKDWRKVAAAWYSGKPHRHADYSPVKSWRGATYPSVGAYCDSVMRRLGA